MSNVPRQQEEPKRLVKLWFPPEAVRAMDSIIRSSRAYAGRDDFVLEAVQDRIREETLGRGVAPNRPLIVESHNQSEPTGRRLAMWESRTARTAPPVKSDGALIGLHNRDFPTLWAADLLASWVSARGEPASWLAYVGRVSSAAWQYSEELAYEDSQRPLSDMKAATGFPRSQNAARRHPSEQRFIEHMVGSVKQGKARGALFALGLAGLVDDETIAPTKLGIKLLEAVAAAGIGARPPHPREAWIAFRDHLSHQLPTDLTYLMRVVSAMAEQPTPEQLLGIFSNEWQGTTAQTNLSGYVSRAREWGLIEPKLINNRYRLTETGQAELMGRA